MTTIDTDRLRALAEAATPGPWEDVSNRYGYDVSETWAVEPVAPSVHNICHVTVGQRDAAYIAAADPQTVLALLDEIERLRGEGEWEYALQADGDDEPWSDWYESRELLADNLDALAARDDERLVRRRKAGPWEPVEEARDA